MNHSTLSRRSVLRGIGGACISLPLLEVMGGWGGPNALPKRFVVFWTPNGTILENWRPTGTPQNYQFGPILKPLEPYKSDIIVLDGVDELSAYDGPGDAHQKATGQGLTGTNLQEGDFKGADGNSAGWGNGISIDQAIANVVGAATKFSSLEFGVNVYGANVGSRISYRGPAQPIPPENDPQAGFTRMFEDFNADPEAAKRRIAERKIVLDAVGADYQKLLPKVSGSDRIKLQAHLDAVRDIEMRLDSETAAGIACVKPDLGVVPKPTEIANTPVIGKLQMDLLAMALACDMTRVASIMWTNSATAKPFPWLGIPEGHHELAHRGDDDDDARAKLTKINTWYAEQFAYLVAKLKAIPEGDGSVLDNTLLIWVNEHQKGNDHDRDQIPYVIAGGCGGAVKSGRWMQVPGKVSHNDLFVGCMNAMGLPDKTFGDPSYCNGALALS